MDTARPIITSASLEPSWTCNAHAQVPIFCLKGKQRNSTADIADPKFHSDEYLSDLAPWNQRTLAPECMSEES